MNQAYPGLLWLIRCDQELGHISSIAFKWSNNALPEHLLLIPGSQAVNRKGPHIVGGFPLGKGRISTTKYGQARSPQGPQCCNVFSILKCLQELRNPVIIRLGPCHRSCGGYLTMPWWIHLFWIHPWGQPFLSPEMSKPFLVTAGDTL